MRKHTRRGVIYSEAMRLAFALAALGPALWLDVENAEKKDECKENLAKIGKAIDAYLASNQGRFPTMPMYPLKKDRSDEPPSLMSILRKLTGNDDVFICPTSPEAIQGTGLCYLWNDQLNGVSRASMTPAQRSARWMVADIGALYEAVPLDHLRAFQMSPELVPMPHVRGYNILYADGTVRWSSAPPRILIKDIPENPFETFNRPGPAGSGSGSGS